ncbi:MAG: cation-translocating P-type ATPase [Patescibacteria group bacterium]
MSQKEWWRLEARAVAAGMGLVPESGLSGAEAGRRLRAAGENRLPGAKPLSPLRVFIAQFKGLMVLVLVAAAAISFFLHERADAITIIAIVILNAVLGFAQEYRAERSLAALRDLSAPKARVRRDGRVALVPAEQVVPGDLLLLEAGDRVAADARLLTVAALAANEAALTGESLPVLKSCHRLDKMGAAPGDRVNMVFAGTMVVAGRGEAVVTATGKESEIGQIADLIAEAEPGPTPLQVRLEQIGRWLVFACLFVCAAVGAAGVLRGETVRTMFLSAVSLGVAAIPEGLPAIVTISLALGVQRMARRAAVVRRLSAVETLGCATVICTDKTGTLTRNEMTVSALFAGGRSYRVSGAGFSSQGAITDAGGKTAVMRGWPRTLAEPDPLRTILFAAAACNNAVLAARTRDGVWQVEGDPTEAALLVLAAKAGLALPELARLWPRLGEVPFDSERKRMSVICRGPDGVSYLVCKGAAEVLLPSCRSVLLSQGVVPLDGSLRARYGRESETMAGQGLRVLALAFRALPRAQGMGQGGDAFAEEGLTLAGLVGMMDPPRPESAAAIRACRGAGIRTIMITGDHPLTAREVGREIGLLGVDGRVMTGDELDRLSENDLAAAQARIAVYARVSPRHKLRIVRALKSAGHVVAMTGDGVNDAPAVKEADIGVAMGMTGTDVTKEAASLVITDDNFATIVAAVEEGRAIYDNIRKFIRYLLGCNTGEILVMFLAMLLGFPLPLLPLQILWVNLVTDGLPALALGLEPPEEGLMTRPPRNPRAGIFAGGLLAKIVWQGVAIGLCTLVAFGLSLVLFPAQLARARTIAFTVLVLTQLAHAGLCRSESRGLSLGGNPYLLWTILISLLMQAAVVYLPLLGRLFATVPLGHLDWCLVLCLTGWSVLLGGAYHSGGRFRRRAFSPQRAGA